MRLDWSLVRTGIAWILIAVAALGILTSLDLLDAVAEADSERYLLCMGAGAHNVPLDAPTDERRDHVPGG